jgi:mannose-6-phosphate isomerase
VLSRASRGAVHRFSLPAERNCELVLRLRPVARNYSWGSPTAIPEYLGLEPTGQPVAELWFGAHSSASSGVVPPAPGAAGQSTPNDLQALLEADPVGTLGDDVLARFGTRLPFLMKIIAPARPLSLQVHPGLERARAGFARENDSGVPLGAPDRNYRDANHKPELVYAITTFDAVSGFRAPRRAAEVLADLDAPLARTILGLLRANPTADGVRAAFTHVLAPATKPSPAEVEAVVAASAARLRAGSPSPRADGVVALLASFFPGDPGVVASLLLNPVTLRPGQALFIPAGGVHAYLGGMGVEIMANSDNVLRAALTEKHMDADELFDVVDFIAAPPIRIAPEEFRDSTKVYYAPVDDFELSVTDVDDDGAAQPLPGRGPRVLLCLEGDVRLVSRDDALTLHRGESAFVSAVDGPLTVRGCGTLVQADVP